MSDRVPDLSRYARQVIFPGIGPDGQRRLLNAHVAIIGCGASGSTLANSLVRAGVGRVRIVDRDFVELNNLQRQMLFDEDDVVRGVPKAIAAADKLRRVNSTVEVEPVVADANASNILELIGDVDLVLDGTDNFDTRYLLNDACIQLGKPWIYSGVIASYGMTMTVIPGETACLRCLYPNPPAPGTTATCDTAGVLNTVVGIVPNIAANEALKLLVGGGDRNPGLIHVDVWSNTYDVFAVPRRPDCEACEQHNLEFLAAETGAQVTSLCGRNAVQVRLQPAHPVRFDELAARLGSAGEVSYNQFLLRFSVNGYELTVFPDSRAIVKGTSDETVAKTLYAKYIGM